MDHLRVADQAPTFVQCTKGSCYTGTGLATGTQVGTCKANAADGAGCDPVLGPACTFPTRCVAGRRRQQHLRHSDGRQLRLAVWKVKTRRHPHLRGATRRPLRMVEPAMAMPTKRRAWYPGWLLVVGLLVGGCSGKLPAMGSPSSCGDQCASTTCPPDTHCALTGNCTPLCNPDPVPSR